MHEGEWHFIELGRRPSDAEIRYNQDTMTTEVWWRGERVAWLHDLDKMRGGQAVLDWRNISVRAGDGGRGGQRRPRRRKLR